MLRKLFRFLGHWRSAHIYFKQKPSDIKRGSIPNGTHVLVYYESVYPDDPRLDETVVGHWVWNEISYEALQSPDIKSVVVFYDLNWPVKHRVTP